MPNELIPLDYRQHIVHAGPHPVFPVGFQVLMRFPNRWGLSIIFGGYPDAKLGLVGSYGANEQKLEAAVIGWDNPTGTSLQDANTQPEGEWDVRGYLDQDEFGALCVEVMSKTTYLPPIDYLEGGDAPQLPAP